MKATGEKILTSFAAIGVTGVTMAFVLAFNPSNFAQAQAIPAPAARMHAAARPGASAQGETAIFAGGCFWGVQGVFQHVKGVQQAISGYAGGSAATARYYVVGSGTTAHAEAVQVTFDPTQVSYEQLMQVFFSVVHDPTQLNRQGPDHGKQYRSEIFATTPEQLQAAHSYITQLNKSGAFNRPIVTLVEAGKNFYPAEAYHQDYLTLHPDEPYVRINDLPKVQALMRLYPSLYVSKPALSKAH